MNYYNEFDPKAAAWLRELIAQGHIPPGHVDERSIADITPHELTGYTQQHFFAGIGGWSLALRLAGWPDDRPVRTGSCPCQPFSSAGLQLGTADPRHLWPVFRDLITFGEATVTFGEQVASKAGRVWLAGIRADLEGMGYAVGGADLCAAGLGSPNIRQRLFWMAHAGRSRTGRDAGATPRSQTSMRGSRDSDGEHGGDASFASRPVRGLEDSERNRRRPAGHGFSAGDCRADEEALAARSCDASQVLGVGDPLRGRLFEHVQRNGYEAQIASDRDPRGPDVDGSSAHFWDRFDVVLCTDGKARRIEPGTFPLAHGIPGRVGLLRGYGNAINPWLAAEFILACEEAL